MRWLTRECLTGQLDDDEWEKRYDDDARNMSALTAALAPGSPERELAELSLSDGQPRSWTVTDSSFDLLLLVGDLQRGYEWAQIHYGDAELEPYGAAEDLNRWPLSACEIGADELERLADGRFEQRFLLWPDGEFGVRFASCTVSRSPADPSDRTVGPWATGDYPNPSSLREWSDPDGRLWVRNGERGARLDQRRVRRLLKSAHVRLVVWAAGEVTRFDDETSKQSAVSQLDGFDADDSDIFASAWKGDEGEQLLLLEHFC